MKKKTFFRKCPNCKTISGFHLDSKDTKKDEKYYCHECTIESKLSSWIRSSEQKYKNG